MTTTAHAQRVKLPICPPRCGGHNGVGYQEWYDDGDGRMRRDHASHPASIVKRGQVDIAVGVSQREDSLGNITGPAVDVYADSDPELTPAEARKLAAALLDAAPCGGPAMSRLLVAMLEAGDTMPAPGRQGRLLASKPARAT